MPAGSAAANGGRAATARAKTSNGGDDDATASAKTGKPPVGGQRQVQSRKRGRPNSHASGSQERPGMQTGHPQGAAMVFTPFTWTINSFDPSCRIKAVCPCQSCAHHLSQALHAVKGCFFQV